MSTQLNTPEFTKSDYGSNISLFQNGELFFATNADKFLPSTDEYDEDWTPSSYIADYLSYEELTAEQLEYASEALWLSKLRYRAQDGYAQWLEDNQA